MFTCSEPCGTVCKRKLDCNTVRFKKFVMSHDCLMTVPAGPRSSEIRSHAMPERMPHPHGPITVYSVDFARFRLPSVGSRGCALLSHVGGRYTVARSVARPANDCQNHRTHFHTEPLAPGLNILAGRSQRAKRKPAPREAVCVAPLWCFGERKATGPLHASRRVHGDFGSYIRNGPGLKAFATLLHPRVQLRIIRSEKVVEHVVECA